MEVVGFVQAAYLDGTDLPARSSRGLHDTRKGLGNPEARIGRGKKGFYLGARVRLVLMVVYAATIVAAFIGRPEMRYNIAYFT